MPNARAVMGLYGKVPAHGDFVRRHLPASFIGPWDAWLQAGMAAARERLGEAWDQAWRDGPAWRFVLPAGACGPDAVAGVLLPSEDMVGRRFPLTLAALLPAGALLPPEGWFARLEATAQAGRGGEADADALASALPALDQSGGADARAASPGEDLDAWLGLGADGGCEDTETSSAAGPDDADRALAVLLGDTMPAADSPQGRGQDSQAPPLDEPAVDADEAAPDHDAPAVPLTLFPPEGGGWWTLGGPRLPAMTWPLPSLPPPETFALFLDADA